MDAPSGVLESSIREHFFAEHQRLEALLDQLLVACTANDRDETSRLWTAFNARLLAHLEAEETYLFPALLHAGDRNARVLVQEHRHIRARLTELGAAVDLHRVRLDSVRDFIDELRAHTRNEERLLYPWADLHLDEPCRTSAIVALENKRTP